jgi:ribosomal protein S27AE
MANDYVEKGKEQCPECKQWVAELDEESGVCGKCVKKFEE